MHSAFNLRLNGGFYETQLNGSRKHCEQWAWLYTRDIIIIDEMSMLTASALHGVNHALNNVMSLSMSHVSNVTFGGKSILTVGDLFQLPAVERFRFNEQALIRSSTQRIALMILPSSTHTIAGVQFNPVAILQFPRAHGVLPSESLTNPFLRYTHSPSTVAPISTPPHFKPNP